MKAQDINIGSRLLLRPDNPYGFGPQILTVSDLRYKAGYKTPWVIVSEGQYAGAYRPKDFCWAV